MDSYPMPAPMAAAADDCGCCEGLTELTPVAVTNPPGLAAIAYRTGTHARFKRSLLAGLTLTRSAALRQLKTRDDDDFAIALFDAWATVADVLTFYQERIATESYLRTATERRSLLELARAIGYELRPGLAVDVDLAFTVESATGAPQETTVPPGTRAQSIPGPGEKAQTFETIEAIPARAAWNAMKPRLTLPHPITTGMVGIVVAGLESGLRAGDVVMVTTGSSTKTILKTVTQVTPQPQTKPELNRTQVRLHEDDSNDPIPVPASAAAATTSGATPAAASAAASSMDAGRIAAVFNPKTIEVSGAYEEFAKGTLLAANLRIRAAAENFAVAEVFANLAAAKPLPPCVTAFRAKAALFGHNAPKWKTLPTELRVQELVYEVEGDGTVKVKATKPGPYKGRNKSWADDPLTSWLGTIGPRMDQIYLDTTYAGITKDSDSKPSVVVLKDGDDWALFRVTDVADVSIADFTLSAKVTRLTLDHPVPDGKFKIQTTTVYAQSDELTLARLQNTDPVATDTIDLDNWVGGLTSGQRLIVCGELDANRGNRACEVATIKHVEDVFEDGGYSTIVLQSALANVYVRDTVAIYGNIARATHGETKQEVLGSGDARRPFQRLPLRQPPLTYVRAQTPSGSESTLTVYVNDVRWREQPSFFGRGPADRVYITRTDDDGRTTVQFGDGQTGARPPTGQENIRAVYRSGSGLGARVKAGQVSLLMTRPAGVSGVVNPLPSDGGADPEQLADARRNAPLLVITLDRIVSLQDFEDFARAFSGIAKALATWTWNGRSRGVFVTVAGPDGAEFMDTSQTLVDLVAAMRKAGDRRVPIRVQSYDKRYFRLRARVVVDPEYQLDVVQNAVDAALRARFSFAARAFGQPVTKGEVIATIQDVPGVVFVDLDALFESYPLPAPAVEADPPLLPYLTASLPEAGGATGTRPAQLLTLDPRPVELEMVR